MFNLRTSTVARLLAPLLLTTLTGVPGRGHDSPARRQPHYERTALAFAGSQILMWRVSGIMNKQMMKHTAGTTMG